MFRFRFSHFSVCLATVVCGVSVGRVLYAVLGDAQIAVGHEAAFWASFLDEYYLLFLSMVILGTLSVTVYCAPAAIAILLLRSASDGRRLFTVAHRMIRYGISPVGIFLFAVHAFYIYGFLLLAMRCIGYRAGARQLPSTVGGLFTPDGRCFFRDYTSVGGVLTLCGLYSFTVMYFL